MKEITTVEEYSREFERGSLLLSEVKDILDDWKIDREELKQQNAAMLEALKKAKYLMDEDSKEGHKIAYVVIAIAIAQAEEGGING